MKSKQILNSFLAILFVVPLMWASESQANTSGSIVIVKTFDFPGTGINTLPQKINGGGDIVGTFIDASGVSRGFVRYSNGNFSAPIVDPNDTVGSTEGRGINNANTVLGDYVVGDGTLHAFFLSRGAFSEYDVPGAFQTTVLSVNEPVAFTGGFDPDGSGIFQAFVSSGGTFTPFSVPGALSTFAFDVNNPNNPNKLVVGYFIDGSGVIHGYFRDASAVLHYPIDPTGSVATILFGINNKNFAVGRYADSSGVTHGLFFIPPDRFATFDYPGAAFTSLNGINAQGFVCGRYVDASGISHGFIARVRGTPPTTQAATTAFRSLAAPLNQSPAAWGAAKPAH